MIPLLSIIYGFLFTAIGTRFFIRLARGGRLLDQPNHRSSHKKPTVRGAGLVIVLVVLSGYLLLGSLGYAKINLSFFVAGSLVAACGFVDDLRSLSVIVRLIIQFIAAGIFVYSTVTIDQNDFAALFIDAVCVVWIVAVTNIFNFMDGIDGIAGSQGIVAGGAWFLFGLVTDISSISVVGGLIVGCSAGFLIYNWSPARVFMGDVGSTFLGFFLAAIPIMVYSELSYTGPRSTIVLTAISALWLFLFDSIVTRVKQIFGGQKFWQPHRDHYYQKLVISGVNHGRVAMYYGLGGTAVVVLYIFAASFGSVAYLPVLFLSIIAALVLPGWLHKRMRDAPQGKSSNEKRVS